MKSIITSLTTLLLLFLSCSLQAVVGLVQDPMGVQPGAILCTQMASVPKNGYDPSPKAGHFIISRIPAASDADARPRWKTIIDDVRGSISILRANKDGRGNWQHHIRLDADPTIMNGWIILKASYVSQSNGPKTDHMFVLWLDNAAGCVLTTASAYPNYQVDWEYQVVAHSWKTTKPSGRLGVKAGS